MGLKDGFCLEEADADTVRTRSPDIRILGTTFSSTLTIGGKLYLPSLMDSAGGNVGFPECQFVLLDAETRASGAFAWIFNILLKRCRISSVTKVWVEKEGALFTFQSSVFFQGSANVPLRLTRFLPLSRDRIAGRVSTSPQETLERKHWPRLKRFHDSCLKCVVEC